MTRGNASGLIALACVTLLGAAPAFAQAPPPVPTAPTPPLTATPLAPSPVPPPAAQPPGAPPVAAPPGSPGPAGQGVANGASEAPSGQRVTLQAAVSRALSRNPTSAVAQADIARSEALVRQARAASYPTLTGNAIYTRLDNDRVLGGNVVSGKNQISANLTLTVPIFAPRAWAAATRASDQLDVTRASYEDVRRQLSLAVGRAYLQIIAQKRIIEASEQARDAARAHLVFARGKRAGGLGNRLDEVRAAQELAASETQVQSAYVGLARSREALGVLTGEDGPVDAADEVDLGEAPQGDAAADEARTRRADVRLLETRVRTTERALKDEWTEYAPSLTAVGQPFFQDPPTITLPKLGWQAQLILSVPLYDGGVRTGVIAERRALADSARASLEGTLRQAKSEVRAAQEALRRADMAHASARDAARLAAEALDLATTAYRAGATSNIEVIDAERRARDAATQASVAEDAARQAKLDLLVASGRFPAEARLPAIARVRRAAQGEGSPRRARSCQSSISIPPGPSLKL